MNAKEMFEKLEFKLLKNIYNTHIMTYKNNVIEIDFDLKVKDFTVLIDMEEYCGSCPVTIDLYQAITQQMKEFGWIE